MPESDRIEKATLSSLFPYPHMSMDSDSSTHSSSLRSITLLALAMGLLFWMLGTLSLISLLLFLAGVIRNQVIVSIPGALISTVSLFFLGLPGVAAFLFRKKRKARVFLWICAALLLLSGAAFPSTLKAPPLVALLFLILGAGGLWMAMVLLHTRRPETKADPIAGDPDPGEGGSPHSDTGDGNSSDQTNGEMSEVETTSPSGV